MAETERQEYEGFAIIELMGHARVAGYMRAVTIACAPFLRVDIPEGTPHAGTRYYSPQAIYGVTPTTEEVARAAAAEFMHAPVQLWQIARQFTPALEPSNEYRQVANQYPRTEE